MGSRVRIRLFHILHFVLHFLFLLLKTLKSGVDDRGHRLRSGSPVTNLPGVSPFLDLHFTRVLQFSSDSPGLKDGYHYCICTNRQLFL